ncbi:YcdB/YcdC domain-containing protein [Clostridium formicaceticum]|uniref:Peptidase propeptide and YPEB domain protein n=1 Tax=Clostridium formicaceticum TaxID=1497 RepID=A0AAC9RRD6_9CLOT|nr:YcdB/YcdC domain-containing protein [Clostridium formicaceticum]AOY75187.1 hypothetical protein BJL90_04265 [Clostridium formicaceticum]ARE89613.1 Peptidase propeptide and YPEB domain protein [Clostridium formicaceticum]
MVLKKTLSGFIVGGLLISQAGFTFAAPQTVTVTEVATTSAAAVSYEMSEKGSASQDAHLTEEEVLHLAKSYIKRFFHVDVEEEQNLQINVNYREDWRRSDKYVWEVRFIQQGRNQYLHLQVTINDEDKELVELRKHQDHRGQGNYVAQYTREEAEEIAYRFLLDTSKHLLDQLILEDDTNNMQYVFADNGSGLTPTEYNIYYPRQKDGVPVMNDGIQIGVNSGSGEVTSYRLNWNEETLPKKTAIITEEKAREVFKENLDVYLSYLPVRDTNKQYADVVKEVKFVYFPHYEGGRWVDAVTGEMVNYPGNPSMEAKKMNVSEKDKGIFENLTSKKKVRSEEMSKEEVSSLASNVLEKIYGNENFKIENMNYSTNVIYGDGNKRKVWNVQFQLKEDVYNNGHLTIDAKTEEILQFNYYNWRMREMMMAEESFKPTVAWEDAYYKAIEVLKNLYPERIKSLELEQTYQESIHYYNDHKVIDPEYYFNFTRKEKNIPYLNNYIIVTIDSTTGDLQGIQYRWDDVTLPQPKNLLDKEEALDLFAQQSEAKLSYVQLGEAKNQKEDQIKLVYSNSPKNSMLYSYLDAHTGKFLDWNGQEAKAKERKVITLAEKLQNHWGERELKIMAANGVIDLEKFDLQDQVTKNDIVKMMVAAMGYWYYPVEEVEELKFTDISTDEEAYQHLQVAVQYKFIDNKKEAFRGEEPVSKEEFAAMLIKTTPLEKAAAIKEIYKLPVKDADEVDPEKLGAVALAYGMDILRKEGDAYQPHENVTLDQAAVGIYRIFKLFGRRDW